MEIISLILVLAISIGLGICLSYYMTIKLMCSDRGQALVKKAITGYTNMTMEIAMDAAKKLSKEDED